MKNICENCEYFERLKAINNHVSEGECHRFPPVLQPETKYEVGQTYPFPLITSIDWCGEFKQNPRRMPVASTTETNK